MKESARFEVKPGKPISLQEMDPSQTDGMKKKDGEEVLVGLRDELNDLQQLLYASQKYGLLIILQGMDTGGKDGVIKHVVSAFNPQGCQVTSFKVPTEEELGHDFLWRVHRAVPRRGTVGIFNRSHYEDVLVVRVENLVPEKVWRQRYNQINEFEELLTESGVVVVKCFLHISKEEQKLRLEDRRNDPHEHWKFRLGDLDTRKKWDAYQAAYEEALNRCSTSHAPWYVIPADKKWYRNLAISRILIDRMSELKMEWPPLEEGAAEVEIV